MTKLSFKPWERVISDVRLVPKMVMLMIFSTILIISKQLWDASTFYDSLLAVTNNAQVAQQHYETYLVQVVWQTALMIIVFVVLLLAAARVMLRQTQYLSDAIKTMADKNLSVPIHMDCKDEYGDVARELEKTRVQLHDMVKAQVASSDELFALTEVMTISMSETKESAQEEFNEIDQLATAMSEMTSTVQTVAAVVADEVRNLAQRTQQATVEIQDMISHLQTSANSAVELMEKSVVEAAEGVDLVTNAGSELDGIVSQVNQINDMNFQIATAAGQQSSVAEEMSVNLTNVRELVEASVVVVGELLETSQLMESNAQELDGKIKQFKV